MAKRVTHYRNFRKKFVKEIDEDIPAGTLIKVHEKLEPSCFTYDDNYWNVYVNGVLMVVGADRDFMIDEKLMMTFNFDIKSGDVIAVSVVY